MRTHMLTSLLSACLVSPAIAVAATEPESAETSWREHVDLYGRLDLMYYRYAQDGVAEDTWNLNGIRDTAVGFVTDEHEAGSRAFTPVAALEVGFGADRSVDGRTYEVAASLAYAGVAGDWGKLTYGLQSSLMTNIAWSMLNPIAQGWGIYFSDLLYAGDPFNYGSRDDDAVLAAGSNFFYGYEQIGLLYQHQGERFSFEADYIPARGDKGATQGVGGSLTQGRVTVAGALARQRATQGGSTRNNNVLGAIYAASEQVNLYLSRLESRTSLGSHYTNVYGGSSWQVNDRLNLSAALSRYQQNSASAYGSGRSLGYAAVLEYALNDALTIYLEADRRNYHGADDGLQLVLPERTRTSNIMAGFYTSF